MADLPTILVATDADLPSAVAAMHACERSAGDPASPSQPTVLLWPLFPDSDRDRRRALDQLASRSGAAVHWRANRPPSDTSSPETDTLLAAARWGAQAGARQLVWPANAPAAHEPGEISVDRAADIVETAMLLERLVEIESRSGLVIETPFADLADEQVTELAIDLGLTPDTCWWWGPEDEPAAVARERWAAAFQAAGMPLDRFEEPKPAKSLQTGRRGRRV